MKKILIGCSVVALMAGLVLAGGNVVPPSSGGASVGTSALPWDNIYGNDVFVSANGTFTIGTNVTVSIGADTTLAVTGNETVGGTLGVTGLSTLTGGLTIPAAGKLTLTTVATVTATNGQPITLSGVINSLQGTGQVNAETNTITLANPSAAGQIAILYNIIGATNLIAVAKTGNFSGPALELDAGQSAILFAPTATNWAGIGQ